VLAISGLGVFAVILLFGGPAIPQDLAFHRFADQRLLLGVPHFWNVVSNLPFVFVGAAGLWFVQRQAPVGTGGTFLTGDERRPYFWFFIGVGLTGFGSAYYHWHPTNPRLVWDRLPMALAFMGLFAAILGERIGPRVGSRLLGPLLLIGLASVLWWNQSDDLRLYYLVQFYPMAAIPFLLVLFPPRYTGTAWLFAALACYVLAKLCENPWDRTIYEAGHWLSGHTIKHLLAALGAYCILRLLQTRRPYPGRAARYPTTGAVNG